MSTTKSFWVILGQLYAAVAELSSRELRVPELMQPMHAVSTVHSSGGANRGC